jgi:hypothetical protein
MFKDALGHPFFYIVLETHVMTTPTGTVEITELNLSLLIYGIR